MTNRIKIAEEQISTLKFQVGLETQNQNFLSRAKTWGEKNGDGNFYVTELQTSNHRINRLKYRIGSLEDQIRTYKAEDAAAEARRIAELEKQAKARAFYWNPVRNPVLQVKVLAEKQTQWPALVPILKPIPKKSVSRW